MNRIIVLVLSFFLIFSNFVLSQEYPTRGEIYDYDSGDMFHYRSINSYGTSYLQFSDTIYRNMEVVEKSYYIIGDSICYHFNIDQQEIYEEYPENNILFSYDSIACFNDLESSVNGILIESDSLYNGRITVLTMDILITSEWILEWSKKRTVGCGLTYYNNYLEVFFSGEVLEENIALVYYMKGDEEWGEEQVIISIPEIDTDNYLVEVFPNPVKETLNIRMNDSFNNQCFLVIMSLTGQQMAQFPIDSNETKIDGNGLKPGIYIYQIIGEDNVLIQSDMLVIL